MRRRRNEWVDLDLMSEDEIRVMANDYFQERKGIFSQLRDRFRRKGKDQEQTVVDTSRAVAETQQSLEQVFSQPQFDPGRSSVDLDELSEISLELSDEVKSAKTSDSATKKSALKSLSDLRASIGKKLSFSSSDRILNLVDELSKLKTPKDSDKNFGKIVDKIDGLWDKLNDAVAKTNDPQKLREAYDRLAALKYQNKEDGRFVEVADQVLAKLAKQIEVVKLPSVVERLATGVKKSPQSAFSQAIPEAKASVSSSKDESKYKAFKAEITQLTSKENLREMSEKVVNKMINQIDSAFSKIKDPVLLDKAITDLYSLKSQVQPNKKGDSQLGLRLDQAIKISEKLVAIIEKAEAKTTAQPKR